MGTVANRLGHLQAKTCKMRGLTGRGKAQEDTIPETETTGSQFRTRVLVPGPVGSVPGKQYET